MKLLPLEYVASATTYIKLMYNEAFRSENIEFFSKTIGTLDNTHNHNFSILYNSYTEPDVGEKFHPTFRKYIHSLHADSGGLQMMTLGKTINEELKDKIYINQGKYSDVAMCFDMLPVKSIAPATMKINKLDFSTRKFDIDNLEFCARETGKNLKRQIDYFLKTNSNAKAMLIAQGNCYDSYMKWVEFVLDELPYEYTNYIKGIAMASSSHGSGKLEDISRAFYYSQLPIELESKHLHLLGIGAAQRLVPFIIFLQSGLYKDIHVSYDSSTHTAAPSFGRYFMDGKNFDFTRVKDLRYNIIHANIIKNFPICNFSVDDIYNILNISTKNYEKKFNDINPAIQGYMIFFASMVKNFLMEVDAIYSDKNRLLESLDGMEVNNYSALYSIKTLEDFNYWNKHIGPFIPSNRIEKYTQPNTLENLFI